MTLTKGVYSEDKHELDIKNLYRNVNDIIKYLELKRKNARTINDLCINSVEAQRSRLLVYAERLMFNAPKEYGRRCEDIIWKKGFYEVYGHVKRLKKDLVWTEEEIRYLQSVFNGGIGFYHHLLMRFQDCFNADCNSILDFPLNISDYGLEKYENDESNFFGRNKLRTNAVNPLIKDSSEWIEDSVYRCLTYIGDLNRYMLDLNPGWDLAIASHYYWRALFWKPDSGVAFNQLGFLSNSQNNLMDAIYYYMRCLCCKKPFEAAEGNLIPLLKQHITVLSSSNNNEPKEIRVLTQFFHLVGVWYFQENVSGVRELCSDILNNLSVFYKAKDFALQGVTPFTSLQDLVNKKQINPDSAIYNDSIFKVLMICCMCHYKLSQTILDSNLLISCASVITAIVYCILEHMVTMLKAKLPVPQIWSTQKKKNRLRRRRIRKNSLSDDSNNSDVDVRSTNTDESEEDLIFNILSDDDDFDDSNSLVANKLLNGYVNGYGSKKINGVIRENADKYNSVMQLLDENYYIMQTMKVGFDWIECNSIEMLAQQESWISFMENLVLFLNYVSHAVIFRNKEGHLFNVLSAEDKVQPIAEDIHLKHFPPLQPIHRNLDWSSSSIKCQSQQQQMRIRIWRCINFGIFLTKLPKSKMVFDADKHWFTCVPNLYKNKQSTVQANANGQQQQGRLKFPYGMNEFWLEDVKVEQIENNSPRKRLSFLIIDSDALVHHSSVVKSLIFSKKFIIVVPNTVIAMLDSLKSVPNARDSIRWLEGQFNRGNPNVRSQRPYETSSLPLVTYPNKKDSEAWMYVKILECCYYLSQRNDSNGTKRRQSNLVWLLTGSKETFDAINSATHDRSLNNAFNLATAAKAAGVFVDYIVDFHVKWKKFGRNFG